MVTPRPPLPLGFLAQAVASASYGVAQLGWVATSQRHQVALGVLLVAVPGLALVAATGWVTGSVGGSTGSGLLCGGWAATTAVTLTTPPGATSSGLGVVAIFVGIALLVPAAEGSRRALQAVMAANAVRFVVAGVAELEATRGWVHTSGWLGLAVALVSGTAAVHVHHRLQKERDS